VKYVGSDDDEALNKAVARFAADPRAIIEFARDGDATGEIPVPLLTCTRSMTRRHSSSSSPSTATAWHGRQARPPRPDLHPGNRTQLGRRATSAALIRAPDRLPASVRAPLPPLPRAGWKHRVTACVMAAPPNKRTAYRASLNNVRAPC
jgi:hypothetical protein